MVKERFTLCLAYEGHARSNLVVLLNASYWTANSSSFQDTAVLDIVGLKRPSNLIVQFVSLGIDHIYMCRVIQGQINGKKELPALLCSIPKKL